MRSERKGQGDEQGQNSPEEEALQKIFEAEDQIGQLLVETNSRKGPYRFYEPLSDLRHKFETGGEARKEVFTKLTWQYLPQLRLIGQYREMGVDDDDLLQNSLYALQEAITATMMDGLEHSPGRVARFAGKCIRRSTENLIITTTGLTQIDLEDIKWKRIFARAFAARAKTETEKPVQPPKQEDGGSGKYAYGARPPEIIFPPETKKHWGGGDLLDYMGRVLKDGYPRRELKKFPETVELPSDWQAWVNFVRKNSDRRSWGVTTVGLTDEQMWSTAYVEMNKPVDDFGAISALNRLDASGRDQGITKGGIEIHGHHTWGVPGGGNGKIWKLGKEEGQDLPRWIGTGF